MPATFESLLELDGALVAADHHPLTPWWRAQMRRFYEHPTARTFVAQVGRGGIKSHTSAKVALNETLFGDWRVPPGETHFWAFVSRSKDEASQRLQLLEQFLRDLHVPFDSDGDQIVLRDEPRGFRVFGCSIGAVSGFRSFGYSADELSKWSVEGVNPSEEVCVSLNAMSVTHPGARQLLVSSAFGMLDYHFDRHAEGDKRDQLVANAPTWVANPSVSQEQTRRLERNPKIWAREYAAQPQAGASSAFDANAIAESFCPRDTTARRDRRIIVLDPSSGRKDSWTWGRLRLESSPGRSRLALVRRDRRREPRWVLRQRASL